LSQLFASGPNHAAEDVARPKADFLGVASQWIMFRATALHLMCLALAMICGLARIVEQLGWWCGDDNAIFGGFL